MLERLRNYGAIVRTMWQMPHARLQFRRSLNPVQVTETYRAFTRRHPRYRVFGSKTVGAALIRLTRFASGADYLAAISGKNQGADLAARARRKAYRVTEIERADYAEQIHAINTSLAERQGRPMDAHYRAFRQDFAREPNFRYYGVLDAGGRLVAYANVGEYGDFAAFSQLLGYRDNDGAMHLLVTEIVLRLLDAGRVRYVMYDTFFGASAGLQRFKRMLGFEPHWVRYELDA